jgi:transposase
LTYFQDEARFGQKGVLTRLWAKTGSRPTALKQTQYDYLYVMGAVCPSTGESVALLTPYVNTQMMNLFLERFSASLGQDVHAVMILDRAGWHVSKELVVPANVTLILLPPRSPELNPIERLWLWVKSHYWANHAYADYRAMLDAASLALRQTAAEPGRIKSICRCDYLERAV